MVKACNKKNAITQANPSDLGSIARSLEDIPLLLTRQAVAAPHLGSHVMGMVYLCRNNEVQKHLTERKILLASAKISDSQTQKFCYGGQKLLTVRCK